MGTRRRLLAGALSLSLALGACAEPAKLSQCTADGGALCPTGGSGGAPADSSLSSADGAAGSSAVGGAAGLADSSGSGGAGAFGGAGGSGASGGAGGFGGAGGSGAFGGAGGSGGVGNCCSPSLSPGCSDAAIASCVCGKDFYCCSHEWDAQCVAEVDQYGCGNCYGGSGGSGGTTGGCSLQLADPLCSACMQTHCCGQAEACFYSAGCASLTKCLTLSCPSAVTLADIVACIDTTCSAYAASKPMLMGYLNCLSTKCFAQCGI
jgi:hypothetical protein